MSIIWKIIIVVLVVLATTAFVWSVRDMYLRSKALEGQPLLKGTSA